MTVLEINATGGHYTEIIAPVVADTGQYISTMWDPSLSEGSKEMYDDLAELIEANRNIIR